LPATLRGFEEEPLPDVVVVDSSFVFEVLYDPRSPDSRHAEARAFAARLINAGSAVVYSSLLFLEAPQCWRRLYARGGLPSPRGATRLETFRSANEDLRVLLAQFGAVEIATDRAQLDLAVDLCAEYNLRPHDALVVALGQLSEVGDLVSLDRDFRRVDGITLWQP
jgi:predicted nucleic acid-binding protein